MMNKFLEMSKKMDQYNKKQSDAKNHRFRNLSDKYKGLRFALDQGEDRYVTILDSDVHYIYTLEVDDRENKYSPYSKSSYGTRYLIPLPQTNEADDKVNAPILSIVNKAGLTAPLPKMIGVLTVLTSYTDKETKKTIHQKKLLYLKNKDLEAYAEALSAAFTTLKTLRGVKLKLKRGSDQKSSTVGAPAVIPVKSKAGQDPIYKSYLRVDAKDLKATIEKDQPDWFKYKDLKPFDLAELLAPATKEELLQFFNLDGEVDEIDEAIGLSDLLEIDQILDDVDVVDVADSEDGEDEGEAEDDLFVDPTLASRLSKSDEDEDEESNQFLDDEDEEEEEQAPPPQPKTKAKAKAKAQVVQTDDEDDDLF